MQMQLLLWGKERGGLQEASGLEYRELGERREEMRKEKEQRPKSQRSWEERWLLFCVARRGGTCHDRSYPRGI